MILCIIEINFISNIDCAPLLNLNSIDYNC